VHCVSTLCHRLITKGVIHFALQALQLHATPANPSPHKTKSSQVKSKQGRRTGTALSPCFLFIEIHRRNSFGFAATGDAQLATRHPSRSNARATRSPLAGPL
jgi:hypothetical protein